MSALPLGSDPRDADLPEHVIRRLSTLRKIDRSSYETSLLWEREEVNRRRDAAQRLAESRAQSLRRHLDSFADGISEDMRRAFVDLSDLEPADRERIEDMKRRGESIGAIATAIGAARQRAKAAA
jgi:hypothetical protein